MISVDIGMAVFGLIFGFSVAAVIAYNIFKNRATIIGGNLLSKDLQEITFLAFPVRKNMKDDITYRVPATFRENLSAVLHQKTWQKDHERRITGTPTRIGFIRMDDKLVPYLHYVFEKVEIIEDSLDGKILHAYKDSKFGLALVAATDETQEKKKKKDKTKQDILLSEDEIYLQFIRNSVEALLQELEDERQARVAYQNQLLPFAQVIACDFLGIDINAVAQTIGVPSFDSIVASFKKDHKDKKTLGKIEELQDKIQEELLKTNDRKQ